MLLTGDIKKQDNCRLDCTTGKNMGSFEKSCVSRVGKIKACPESIQRISSKWQRWLKRELLLVRVKKGGLFGHSYYRCSTTQGWMHAWHGWILMGVTERESDGGVREGTWESYAHRTWDFNQNTPEGTGYVQTQVGWYIKFSWLLVFLQRRRKQHHQLKMRRAEDRGERATALGQVEIQDTC